MKIFVLILILCYLIHVESEESCSGWIYIPKFNRCIRHFCNRRTWVEAKVVCERNNSRLVIPCNREYSDMVATLASLYEFDRANSWIGFKAANHYGPFTEPSHYRPIEDSYCTGTALNWAPGEPTPEVQECVQVLSGEENHLEHLIGNAYCWKLRWFVCEKEGGCDTV